MYSTYVDCVTYIDYKQSAVTTTLESHVDWRWPLSRLCSMVMAFSAQLAEDVGAFYLPSPLELPLPLHAPPMKTSER
jgi:hypothetical protein